MTNGLDQPAVPETPQEASALRASSIRRDEGVDKFQALQRVLYRSAKQDPERTCLPGRAPAGVEHPPLGRRREVDMWRAEPSDRVLLHGACKRRQPGSESR